MTLFERIQELAKKRDKTLKDISLELGYSKNYLYTLQKQSPKAENLQVIADYFNVSTDYLLGRTDNPDPDNTKLDTNDLDDVLDNMKSFGGVEMTDRDKETIRAFLKGKFSDR
ncbi:Phage transcriptional regulator, Cro, CI family [Enterococcus mundtii 1A]|uniref:helix-turn-helix domain-containing protein n=1 Tax=Enterococcus mundtii TaxID=53346 RepID=UPI002303F256|nr:helix-turn-helix transcriptional regulator [Enterococcus mundtii]MDA9429116.1 Phage transcriptional regulator, Cro, CI family [Enterococcus mundtii 1A]